MRPIAELLGLARQVATAAGDRLLASDDGDLKSYRHAAGNPKEIKAKADMILDEEIVRALSCTGLSILSEESGLIKGSDSSAFRFVVDPLDGTFNFVHSLGPSAVSIALWEGTTPVFGVVYRLDRRELAWGGLGIGAWSNGSPMAVSKTTDCRVASLCTGFPARFDTAAPGALEAFCHSIAPYSKVRMIGSAAVSLLHVASGASDAYSERNIMLWDVAAGIALVQGAGGKVAHVPGTMGNALDVFASNGSLGAAGRDQPYGFG